MSIESEAYARHKNLKLAASEVGIPWQTLYVRLKKEGVSVLGDKSKYGSEKDKIAAAAEEEFSRIIPFAINNNLKEWQPKVDFDVGGVSVDVKASRPASGNKRFKSKRWAFCIKRQQFTADFLVCFAKDDDLSTKKILLVPNEIASGLQTISMTCSGRSKWSEYEVTESELLEFFLQMKKS